jgi:hypothetical protein
MRAPPDGDLAKDNTLRASQRVLQANRHPRPVGVPQLNDDFSAVRLASVRCARFDDAAAKLPFLSMSPSASSRFHAPVSCDNYFFSRAAFMYMANAIRLSIAPPICNIVLAAGF